MTRHDNGKRATRFMGIIALAQRFKNFSIGHFVGESVRWFDNWIDGGDFRSCMFTLKGTLADPGCPDKVFVPAFAGQAWSREK
jgi:hypothetical protein